MPPSLDKKILAITRKAADAREFSRLVSSEGGAVIALSTIDIVPKNTKVVEEFINSIKEKKHEYCAFLSSHAVDILFDLASNISKTDQLISILNSRIVIAIGPKTRQSLIYRGINVKMVPERYSSDGLVELLSRRVDLVREKGIIIPRSEAANEFTKMALSNIKMTVDEMFLYTIQTSDINVIWRDFILLLKQKKIDALIFTSASSVHSFFENMQKLSDDSIRLVNSIKAVISIGPYTSKELRSMNISCVESTEHTIRGTFELAKVVLR